MRLYFLLLMVSLSCCTTPSTDQDMDKQRAADFDWQGHRGARGLVPENTIPAFLKALEYESITTMELDLAVSKDSLLVVSHEPWMSHHICSHPDLRPVSEAEEEELLLFQMPYEDIRQFDCGRRGNERFPQQKPMAAYKPLLAEVVEAVEQYCQDHNRAQVNYNIEIKSKVGYDGLKTPTPEVFTQLVYDEINRLGIQNRSCIQSFDVRPLQLLQAMDSTVTMALLIENPWGVEANLKKLGFTPDIYSPYYKMLTANTVKEVHDRGSKVIPWTVNDTSTMKALVALGVDGIITDYPDKISAVLE
jgi:glycerophosphoryl diester phosphodiesterase